MARSNTNSSRTILTASFLSWGANVLPTRTDARFDTNTSLGHDRPVGCPLIRDDARSERSCGPGGIALFFEGHGLWSTKEIRIAETRRAECVTGEGLFEPNWRGCFPLSSSAEWADEQSERRFPTCAKSRSRRAGSRCVSRRHGGTRQTVLRMDCLSTRSNLTGDSGFPRKAHEDYRPRNPRNRFKDSSARA